MNYVVDQSQVGERLDVFVASQLPTLSRAYVARLCNEGKISVNGQPTKPGNKLHAQDQVSVDYDPAKITGPPSVDLPIIYEDDNCVVINKPAGVLTHATGRLGQEPSVASFLRSKLQDMNGDRAGIVHRLDRATSGVIIGAKSQAALSWLQKQFASRKVKKIYVAVVQGTLEPNEAIVDMPIQRNPKAPATFRVNPSGKPANTHYKVLKSNGSLSLVELTPQTGRTHQLRVHLAKLGHPIVGDPLYGDGHFGDRLFLHALSLEITLPDRQRHTFSSPLPPEFNRLLEKK